MPDRPTRSRSQSRAGEGDWPGRQADVSDSNPSVDADAVDQLARQLEIAKSLAAEHLASLQRTAADFANFKRRTAEDREREFGLASETLLRKLLGVVDDFDRALDHMPPEFKDSGWIEGVVLLDRKLSSLLESEGVTPIESVGRAFDPHEHEAIAIVPGTGRPDGEIVDEVQRGYRVRDRVLRPALVAVAGGETVPGDTTTHIN